VVRHVDPDGPRSGADLGCDFSTPVEVACSEQHGVALYGDGFDDGTPDPARHQ
jgi:hypothetical protein